MSINDLFFSWCHYPDINTKSTYPTEVFTFQLFFVSLVHFVVEKKDLPG